jgi:hypothetical protein
MNKTLKEIIDERNCCGMFAGDCKKCDENLLLTIQQWIKEQIEEAGMDCTSGGSGEFALKILGILKNE